MEKFFKSIALIRNVRNQPPKWLVIWDSTSSHWDFVLADRLEKETFRETIGREVAWRLNLNRDKDFLVSNMAQLNVEYAGFLPGETEEKNIGLAFYNVDLYRKHSNDQVNKRDDVCWVSSREIHGSRTIEDKAINPTVCTWIKKWEVILPWESDGIAPEKSV